MIRMTLRHMALAGAALTVLAGPVAAVVNPASGAERVDLAYYDAVTRTGMDQLATDPYCASPEMLAIDLGEVYGEDIVATHARDDGRSFDLWASPEMGTWTVSYTRPDGVACVIGSGTDWDAGDSATERLVQVGLRP
ncbi:hypothetical protein [Falsirhodobacter halotolerans]|uniref:hypothetical protein n=1 Tax=Falsirhodobacter halotolerans TaxID=1146892 RepID=UPI001FD12133|nr:hypothetical protein [Falsirhodobacter halotolerans]MCJ8138237.1 hypothetical protein [Falsirhodobacter halotolerans]